MRSNMKRCLSNCWTLKEDANMSEKMRMKTNTMLRFLTSRFTSIRIPSPRKKIWSSKGKAYVRGSSSGSKGNMKGRKIPKNHPPGSKLSLSLTGCKERAIPPLHRRSCPLRWKRTTRCFDSLWSQRQGTAMPRLNWEPSKCAKLKGKRSE